MENRAVSTRTLVRALWRAKWVISLCAVLCTVMCVAAVALLIPPKYAASVVFFIQGPEEKSVVESSMYILQTRQTLDAVLGQAENICSREELADRLEVRVLGDTPMMEVTLRHTDAQVAKKLADAVTAVLPLRLAEVIPGTRAEVADAPELPQQAENPRFALAGLLGLLVGLAIPVSVISAREYWKAAV